MISGWGRLLAGVFLIAHGLVHALYAAPPGPGVWPFELKRSWLLSPLGLNANATRAVGTALWVLTAAGFAAAGLGVFGVPGLNAGWPGLTLFGAAASLLLLGLFWHWHLGLGVLIDLGLAGWLWLAG